MTEASRFASPLPPGDDRAGAGGRRTTPAPVERGEPAPRRVAPWPDSRPGAEGELWRRQRDPERLAIVNLIDKRWDERQRERERRHVLLIVATLGLAVAVIVALTLAIATKAWPGEVAVNGLPDENYCTLWTRAELVIFVARLEAVDRKTITVDALAAHYRTKFVDCVTGESEPPLPDKLESDREYFSRVLSAVHGGDTPGIGEAGAAPGTLTWIAWCRRNFPSSFDAKTGTVILEADNRGHRVPCPG
jgi:hypothetical protein